ncbi:MAG TPA: DNA-directed RNA polymerase subunit omega [Anaerohalosphaeraceae bacterium]|jgi:DNA-directed RNA polymerase subunit omega|nr:DNA-directed RNA polymerase subunit omega [Anaerohalosphaeraceae bacterium]
MIEELKDTAILMKAGGRFKLSTLIQKRMVELMEGGRPLIADTEGKTTIEIVIEEIKQNKIAIDYGTTPTVKTKKDPF